MSPELLTLRGLGKTFPNNGSTPKTVLADVNFSLAEHDSLAIVGPSGCGKTTLLLMIAGVLAPTAGEIRLDDEIIHGPIARMALVLQEYGLFPWKTVADNITLGARLQNIPLAKGELATIKSELGIDDLDPLYPHQLSGGQRQRVALARALLLHPRLLLLDEPFAALDTITRERLQNRLLLLFGRRRFSFIIVTHNIDEAICLGRRILILDQELHGIRAMIDNPGAGEPEYQQDPRFFQCGREIRNILKEFS